MYAWPRATITWIAVAAASLVGMTDEFDVLRAFRDNHGLLPSLIGRQLRPGFEELGDWKHYPGGDPECRGLFY